MEHTRDHRWTWSENNVRSTRHYQKKTWNKETETQTYKLDAKEEYGVFVGGGEGFFFFFFLYSFGSGNKSWLFTFSLWIFGILEWLILNKRKYLWGFFLKLHPLESCFEQKVTQRWESCLSGVIFLGCFPLYLVYISIKDFVSALYRWYCCSVESLSSYTVTVHTDNDLAAVVSSAGNLHSVRFSVTVIQCNSNPVLC